MWISSRPSSPSTRNITYHPGVESPAPGPRVAVPLAQRRPLGRVCPYTARHMPAVGVGGGLGCWLQPSLASPIAAASSFVLGSWHQRGVPREETQACMRLRLRARAPPKAAPPPRCNVPLHSSAKGRRAPGKGSGLHGKHAVCMRRPASVKKVADSTAALELHKNGQRDKSKKSMVQIQARLYGLSGATIWQALTFPWNPVAHLHGTIEDRAAEQGQHGSCSMAKNASLCLQQLRAAPTVFPNISLEGRTDAALICFASWHTSRTEAITGSGPDVGAPAAPGAASAVGWGRGGADDTGAANGFGALGAEAGACAQAALPL
eukprot:1160760-Pelagomonas_calceolata.AAC.12